MVSLVNAGAYFSSPASPDGVYRFGGHRALLQPDRNGRDHVSGRDVEAVSPYAGGVVREEMNRDAGHVGARLHPVNMV